MVSALLGARFTVLAYLPELPIVATPCKPPDLELPSDPLAKDRSNFADLAADCDRPGVNAGSSPVPLPGLPLPLSPPNVCDALAARCVSPYRSAFCRRSDAPRYLSASESWLTLSVPRSKGFGSELLNDCPPADAPLDTVAPKPPLSLCGILSTRLCICWANRSVFAARFSARRAHNVRSHTNGSFAAGPLRFRGIEAPPGPRSTQTLKASHRPEHFNNHEASQATEGATVDSPLALPDILIQASLV